MLAKASNILVLALFTLTLTICNNPIAKTISESPCIPGYNSTYYSIKKFVDGDTFWIDNRTEKGEKIRLIGVDAPESRNMFNIKKEAYGKEASDYVKQLLQGKKVRLEYDVDKYDRYGRTLAYVYLEDGTFLNAHLLEYGYAQIATFPPNVKHVELFLDLQRKARAENKGLWAFN